MIIIDLKVFILTIFILNCLSFILFYFLSGESKINVCKLFILGVVVFFGKLVIGDWMDLVLVTYIFIDQKYFQKCENNFLTNILLVSLLFVSFSSLITSNFIISNVYFSEIKGLFFMAIELTITLIILSLFVLCYKKLKIDLILKENDVSMLTFFLLYVYLMLMLVVTILRSLQSYDILIKFVLLFVLFQAIFSILFLLIDRRKRKQRYEDKLFENQLENLKNYTQELEEDYQSVRKFRHDYKNMFLSLRINVENKEYNEIINFLDDLEDYSDSYFNNSTMDVFKDLSNIQNEYLKSIFINKLHYILKLDLNCQFECRDMIKDLGMDIFDAIRIISITLDNAIEAALESKEKKINIALLEKNSFFILKVENSFNKNQETLSRLMSSGFSTKDNHSGLGLSNVEDIKKKYSNIFLQYEKEENWFFVKMMISKGGIKNELSDYYL